MKTTVKGTKGFVLIFSLLYAVLLMMGIAGFLFLITDGARQGNRTADTQRAYYLADAGLADAFMALRNYSVLPTPAAYNVANANYTVVPGAPAGSYNVAVTSDGQQWPTYTMVSQGNYNGITKTLTLLVKRISISKWYYISNTEVHPTYGNLWWVTGMLTTGPTQTNGRLNIFGDPIFDGPVTQANSAINFWHNTHPSSPMDNPDFRQGLTLGTSQTYFPTQELIDSIRNAAGSSGGILLNGDTTIKFLHPGKMQVTNAIMGWNNQVMDIPANKALFVQGGNVEVEGKLQGQLTVGTDRDIRIASDILYSSDPRTDPTSTDLLGLVALNNVSVASKAPKGIEIDAYIVALTGTFQVEDFWAGGFKGDMTQFGGLTNNYCGPTGVVDSNGNIIHGYNQIQLYDNRFAKDLVPPWFTPVRDAKDGRVSYMKISLTES